MWRVQDDLMKRISDYESRRLNMSDKGTLTDAPKPEPAPVKKPGKLCGLGMRVTEEAPHRIVGELPVCRQLKLSVYCFRAIVCDQFVAAAAPNCGSSTPDWQTCVANRVDRRRSSTKQRQVDGRRPDSCNRREGN